MKSKRSQQAIGQPRFDGTAIALEAALRRLELDTAISALLSDALTRVVNGTYGNCQRCSESIAPERLRALPWARLCVGCQEAVDQAEASE
jgi:DnaK suppressor protein